MSCTTKVVPIITASSANPATYPTMFFSVLGNPQEPTDHSEAYFHWPLGDREITVSSDSHWVHLQVQLMQRNKLQKFALESTAPERSIYTCTGDSSSLSWGKAPWSGSRLGGPPQAPGGGIGQWRGRLGHNGANVWG